MQELNEENETKTHTREGGEKRKEETLDCNPNG